MKSTLLLLVITKLNLALNPISIKGAKFFDDKTGDQFYIKGVAYQPRDGGLKFEDPLANAKNCQRDVKMFKELGINTIRVYEVDPLKNHDECMKLLSENNIYLMLDLPIPQYSIVRSQPKYNLEILEHYKLNVDAFQKYDNLLGFFAGNEVNNNKSNTDANPFVKAVLRDIKAYIKATSKRAIPVGYANNDDPDTRLDIQKYFNCGSAEERADFFGINIYRWCGKTSFQKSGFDEIFKEYEKYSIPSFFSEYGCNTISPRDFAITESIYNDDMSGVFSGGIAYEYSQEDNNYGLVEINNGQVKKLKDFSNLQSKLKDAKPTKAVKKDSYSATDSEESCPESSKNWEASNKLPPVPSKGACDCMMSSLKCTLSKDYNITKAGKKAGDMFSYLCENGADCSKFSQDGKKGEYGVWSTCKPSQQLSWALNQVYLKNNENSEACSTDSQVVKPSKQESQCKDIKADIGKDGKSGSSSTYDKSPVSTNILAVSVLISLLLYV